jgi:hypothetical protein
MYLLECDELAVKTPAAKSSASSSDDEDDDPHRQEQRRQEWLVNEWSSDATTQDAAWQWEQEHSASPACS